MAIETIGIAWTAVKELIKAAGNIQDATNQAKVAGLVNAAQKEVNEANELIRKYYVENLELHKKVSELEAKQVSVKENYNLEDFEGYQRVYKYAGTEQRKHLACPVCMDRDEKVVILQRDDDTHEGQGVFHCLTCTQSYYLGPKQIGGVKTKFEPFKEEDDD